MPKILLTPTRSAPPVCTSYTNEDTVVRFEIEVRKHRAHTDTFEIDPLDDRADGAFRVCVVSSASTASVATHAYYTVDLVDASGQYDACSCPDFLSNHLGTCKHLEAVRRMLATHKASRRTLGDLPAAPTGVVLGVEARGDLTLRAVGPNAVRALKSAGVIAGDELRPAPGAPWRAGVYPGNVRVLHAAVAASAIVESHAEWQSRAMQIGKAFQSGTLRADILSAPLFPYQETGARMLVTAGRALLADDMGLGKTVQAIAACEVLRLRGEARRILVICPASLKAQWAREIAKYAGEKAVVVGGGESSRGEAIASDAPYLVVNYELTWRELARLRASGADVVVLDEAQRAKNFRTKTAETLRALPSRFLFVLTGTPVENRLDDLYGLLQLIDPRVLGPLWRFNFDFHVQGERGKIVGCKNLTMLRALIAPVVLRRRKEEVLAQLPPLLEQTRHVPLSKEQLELEETHRRAAARLSAIAERRPLKPKEHEQLLASLLKARQACNAAELCDPERRVKSSPKLDELEALVTEIAQQGTQKILVFSEWTEMLKLAAERLTRAGIGHVMLHGGVPTDKRAALLDRFRESADAVVLLSTDAGGVGLNLQVATYVIHLDLPWNPARLDQRTARAHRIGQTRGVSVTYLCAETGIERGIEGTLAGKRALRSAALDESSTADELTLQSFTSFLRSLKQAMEAVQPGSFDAGKIEGDAAPDVAVARRAEAPPEPEAPVALDAKDAAPPSGPPATAPSKSSLSYAKERLRLAHVVLQAGFAADAARAAYEGVAASLRSLAAAPTGGKDDHAALVAALFRDLLPKGRVPQSLPGLFARLHDLTHLEDHGVVLEPALAADAVREAEAWIARVDSAS